LSEIKYKAEVVGRGGISARVVAHSKSAYSGTEIVTWEYEAPKCILAEINTHRVFSRNAQSSRAVPVSKVIDQIRNNPVTPIYWGSNQAGMVAGEEIDTRVQVYHNEYDRENPDDGTRSRDVAWPITADKVADLMQSWEDAGYHKQIVNRIGEAFTFVRGVITATEIDNFFHLRVHPAADPFMQELARCMWEAYQQSEAEVLYEGEWHTPYVEHARDGNGHLYYIYPNEIEGYALGECAMEVARAKEFSAAATAQVSFRKLDLSDETVDRVYSRLIDDETPHASCVEHQATPIKYTFDNTLSGDSTNWPEGVSHMDREGTFWSGNFKDWIQNRKLIPNESCSHYKGRDKETK
jgi:hypothetical protein